MGARNNVGPALIRKLDGDPSLEVPSPTFTLVQSYDCPGLHVSHYDLYRLKNEAEMQELGLEEALEDGAVLVEWPERAGAWLPADALRVRLGGAGMERRAILEGPARWREQASESKTYV